MADSEISNTTPPLTSSHSTTPPPSSPPPTVLQTATAFSSLQVDFPSSTNVARSQRADNEQEEVRQSAVNALHQYSVLAMHVIANEE
ncbi:11988_t:CDS:1, partial [Gigaspora margarita]